MKTNIFITGESGTIPLAMQDKDLCDYFNINVVNSYNNDIYEINDLKKHQSFKIRNPELDFTDRELLFSNRMKKVWENTNIIVHSGAFVGTDFCNAYPNEAIRVNVEGTKNIVDICNRFDIKLVYFSTTAIFDTNDYSKYKLITEDTKIKPTTLYGITKYAGEQIVEKLCNTSKIIIRPVFGFGNYPDDLHSALTKLIYVAYKSFIDKNYNEQLNILLDKSIEKTYTRVENLAVLVYKIMSQDSLLWNDVYNIGAKVEESANWHKLIDKVYNILFFDHHSDNSYNIKYCTTKESVFRNINFISYNDYLHWHNISTIKLERLGILNNQTAPWVSLDKGIEKTFKSVKIKNYIKPYWI